VSTRVEAIWHNNLRVCHEETELFMDRACGSPAGASRHGDISGTVKDSTDAVIRNAVPVKTNSDGLFAIPDLRPGV
jgi:hypothetical protein